MSEPRRLNGRLSDEALLSAMSEAAHRLAAEEAGPGPTPAVWHRLQARRAQTPARPRRRKFPIAAVAGMAAVLAIGFGVRVVRKPRPITYAVSQGAAEQDGYIRGLAAGGNEVRFSDGTRVELPRGARLSVLGRESDGARLRVEDGEAHFEVVHRPHAAWTVEAGPFVVYVTGTTFDVRWSGSEEVVEVRLRSGSVRVGGPLLPEKVTLRPGQHLTARLATGELRIDDERVAAPRAAAPVPVAPAAVVLPAAEAPAVAEAPVAETPTRASVVRLAMPHKVRARPIVKDDVDFVPAAWPAEIAAGGGAEVVAAAEAHGVERTLAEVDGAALAALADAARYGGRRELAVRALLAERSRFKGTPAAQAAAFYLGRLADDRGDTPAALNWFRIYLADSPRGPYASEALGRAMLTVERLSGRAAAHDIAAEYVHRFPNGTYLLQAHSILANP